MNRSELSPVITAVESSLETHFPDAGERNFIVGVSGGPDSMVLLYLLQKMGVKGTVVHCNYQLRGQASDRDQQLVEDVASMWGFECLSVRFDTMKNRKSGNFQNRARNQRYQVFLDMMKETDANAIALAHHQDDQLETIMQKIMRGSGLSAWQGMQAWNGRLYRPLLGVSKAGILEFATENSIPYRLDSSNEESTYARNFLRNGWFPVLDDLFPGWRENLLKVRQRGEEHEQLLQALIEKISLDDRSIERQEFLDMDAGIRGSVLIAMLKNLTGSAPVSGSRLDSLPDFSGLQPGKKVQLTDDWYLFCDRDRFLLQQTEVEAAPLWLLHREPLQKESSTHSGLKAELVTWSGSIDTTMLQMDADALRWPLIIRPWREGDRFNPLGMEGSQTVADLLTNRKVSSADKSRSRVVESADEAICAVLFPLNMPDASPDATPDNDPAGDVSGVIANWARCTSSTSIALTLTQASGRE